MKVTYDAQARAAYIYLSDAQIFITRECGLDDRVVLDLDIDMHVVGVELLDVDEPVVDLIGAAQAAQATDGE